MQSCTIHHCVLFFLTLTFTTVPTLAFITITVKLHQSAKLPCTDICSGVGKWTMFHNRDNVLAQCDQTSCSSVDGYKISHDEYVKGDLSLTITAADYTHRGLYTCNCNSMDVRDVRLSIETLMSSVELNTGEDLLMDLPVPQSLEVIYKPKDSSGLYGEQICTVTKHILQCKAEYTPRASLSYPELTLRDVNITHSGIYTIRDVEYEENIYIYTLYVIEIQRITDGQPVNQLLAWLLPALALMMGVIIGLVCFLKIRSKLLKRVKLQQEEQECLEQERLLQQEEQERLEQERLLQQEEQGRLEQERLQYTESLKHIVILEQYLEKQILLHKKKAEAYKQQRRTNSEADLDRILSNEDWKMIIQPYKSLPPYSTWSYLYEKKEKQECYNRKTLKVFKSQENLRCAKSNVKINQFSQKKNASDSLQGASSNPDVLEVQSEEKISLIQQDDAGAVMVNEQNRTAEYQKLVTLSGKPPCVQ